VSKTENEYASLKYPGGAYKGYAFNEGTQIETLHKSAWDKVKDIDRKTAITKVEHLYGRNVYHLESSAVEGLHEFEKLVLANGSPIPFGGSIQGNKAEIYND